METALAIDLWLDTLEIEGRSPETLKTYRALTKPLLHVMPDLAKPDLSAVRAYLAEYRRSHAPASLRTVFVTWQNLCNWSVGQGIVAQSPLRSIRPPRLVQTTRDAYTRSELQSVFGNLRSSTAGLKVRDHAIAAVLLDCGLRVSELCRLELTDFSDIGLHVRLTKTGRPRIVPIGRRALLAVRRYLVHTRPRLRPDCNRLFVSHDGRPMTRSSVALMLRRVGSEVGIPLSAHRFRHTFATEHLRAGTSMEALRRLGGWADYSMIQNYAHLVQRDLERSQAEASILDLLEKNAPPVQRTSSPFALERGHASKRPR